MQQQNRNALILAGAQQLHTPPGLWLAGAAEEQHQSFIRPR